MFHVSLEGILDKRYDVTIRAWTSNRLASGSLPRPTERRSHGDLIIRTNFLDNGLSWEHFVGTFVMSFAKDQSTSVSFDLPPSFYLRGRSNWAYLALHFRSVRYVFPYDGIKLASSSALVGEWLSEVQPLSDPCYDKLSRT